MRRRVGLFLFCGLVLPLIVVANASAQGATLELSPQSGPAGTDVTVNGFSFSRDSPAVEGVKIRLSRRDGPVLTTTPVSSGGTFTTTARIPDGTAPGEYLIIGTQQSMQGRHVFGTPGRAKFRVTAGSAGAAAAPGRGTSQTLVVLGTLMVVLILAAGGTLAVRRLRTSDRPLGS